MSKILKLKRGKKETMPALSEAELVYASDTNELYIGSTEGNKTLSFDGGRITDSTKGILKLKSGREAEIRWTTPGELFYLEDQHALAIGLINGDYLIFDKEIKYQIADLYTNKRDKRTAITTNDIGADQIQLHHLSEDVREMLGGKGINEQISLILAANSITSVKLAISSVTESKIAINAVSETKIKDGSITFNKLDQELQLVLASKLFENRNVFTEFYNVPVQKNAVIRFKNKFRRMPSITYNVIGDYSAIPIVKTIVENGYYIGCSVDYALSENETIDAVTSLQVIGEGALI